MNNRMEDARSKKVVFVASCLLNTNNKVMGLARYPGMCKEVLNTINKNGLGVMQMQCPETLYLGVQRWWATKNLYDNVGFRPFCRNLAKQIVDYMVAYEQVDYETVAVLCCDGSPTCGYKLTGWDENWGGPPADLDFNETLVEGSGVYIEELIKEIEERNIKVPPFYGLALDDESADMEKIIGDFEDFIKSVCKEK